MRVVPSIAAVLPDDHDIYLVLDDFGGRLGRAWRETDEEHTALPSSGICSMASIPILSW
jgi:hypothetical protein